MMYPQPSMTIGTLAVHSQSFQTCANTFVFESFEMEEYYVMTKLFWALIFATSYFRVAIRQTR